MKQLMLLLEESQTAAQAKKMGLEYMKFGRWGKKGKVTHKTEKGKLVPIKPGEDTELPRQYKGKDIAAADSAEYMTTGKIASRDVAPPSPKHDIGEPNFKSDAPGTKFTADSDNWYDDTVEWTIDPMKRRNEIDALAQLKKLALQGSPTKNTIAAIYMVASRVNRPNTKRIANQAAKILKNAYKGEFKNQFGGGGGKVSQASEFLSHLKQALTYND